MQINGRNSMKLNIELYKKMFLIRKSEEMIQEYYLDDNMKTPMHMSMGSEALVVGICYNLSDEDQIIGTYRSHAGYLAKTNDSNDFFAEMYGKDIALIKGKGGSMHLINPSKGHMGSSAIVASSIPCATGLAFANKYLSNGNIVVSFFGDGAINEGNFWESVNVACVKRLPIVFVCEDNDFAVHTPTSVRNGFKSITDVISKFDIDVYEDSTTDVEKMYNISKEAIENTRKYLKPCFIKFKYYRYLEHVGINYDFDAGYRDKNEYKKWLLKDPITIQREKILNMGMDLDELKNLESEVLEKIDTSIKKADSSKLPKKNELHIGVYS